MQIVQLRMQRDAFRRAAILTYSIIEYSHNPSEINASALLCLSNITKSIPLPSGRWGNVLALALELNEYIAAKLLFEERKQLELNTDLMVTDANGHNAWNLYDEYLFSQLTYNKKDISIDGHIHFIKDDYYEKNAKANEELAHLLHITDKDIDLVKNNGGVSVTKQKRKVSETNGN